MLLNVDDLPYAERKIGATGSATPTRVASLMVRARGGRTRGARTATNPPRGLTAEALAASERNDIRLMITGLLAESGITVSDVSQRGDHDELVLALAPGWRPREGRARVFYRGVLKRDAVDLDRLARQTPLSEVILFEVSGDGSGRFAVPASVQFVSTAELIDRLGDSAAIHWDGAEPKVDRSLVARLRALDMAESWVDELGIRALPILARNKIPPAWTPMRQPPDELFERIAFRLLTQIFRFGGTDLGAIARAEREPDALLEAPAGSPAPFSAVVDCKASRDGWSMSADDETRLVNYVTERRDDLAWPDMPFLIVISSAFATGTAAFNNRRQAVQEGCGARLVYWRAGQLAASALAVEDSRMAPAEREQLPWQAYLDQGRPSGGIECFEPARSPA